MVAARADYLDGDQLYQQRARVALPLLVRQAHARVGFVYSQLAAEVGMPNARNLNAVLGYIGKALVQLSSDWKEKIPVIQCLVVNKHTGLPGNGWIQDLGEFRTFSRRQQRAMLTVFMRIYLPIPNGTRCYEHLIFSQ